jgi:hypothetical protein
MHARFSGARTQSSIRRSRPLFFGLDLRRTRRATALATSFHLRHPCWCPGHGRNDGLDVGICGVRVPSTRLCSAFRLDRCVLAHHAKLHDRLLVQHAQPQTTLSTRVNTHIVTDTFGRPTDHMHGANSVGLRTHTGPHPAERIGRQHTHTHGHATRESVGQQTHRATRWRHARSEFGRPHDTQHPIRSADSSARIRFGRPTREFGKSNNSQPCL